MKRLCATLLVLAACDKPPAPTPPPNVNNGAPADPVTPGQAQAVDDLKDKWSFKEGSWVELRITEQTPRGQQTYNQKNTIKKLTDDKVTILTQEQGAGQAEKELPLKPEMKKAGTETLDVDGKSFACAIWEKIETVGAGKETMKLWVCKDAPGRIVKQEHTTKTGDKETSGSGTLKKLGQRLTIGTHTVTYAIFEYKETGGDAELTITQWASDQVPGFVVKEERREKSGKLEVLRMKELVDFEVK